jgi:methylenetetrahydrofolate reductase (NADPH)
MDRGQIVQGTPIRRAAYRLRPHPRGPLARARPAGTAPARCPTGARRAVRTAPRSRFIHSIFVIAGDSTEPAGPFTDSLALLEQLATSGHHFRSIGVGGYPEGHPHISDEQVDRALESKARHATHIVTQMCFRGSTTATWARQVKRQGVDLPIRIGLPGAVTRQKLARIAANIGLGQSARFLVKQNSMLLRGFLPGGYRPDRIINALAPTLGGTGHTLAGFHFFTFNEVTRTEAWRQAWLTRLHQAAQDA